MLNETEAAASFHGLCHFLGRLSRCFQTVAERIHAV